MKLIALLFGLSAFLGIVGAVSRLVHKTHGQLDADYQAGSEARLYDVPAEANPWVGTDGARADAWLDGWTMRHKMEGVYGPAAD